MTIETTLESRNKSELHLIGSFCQVHWSSANRLAKRQCEKCVYVVRGVADEMICVELIYDAIDGVHRNDAIYWVPMHAIQYLRVLSEAAAKRRIESLEREVMDEFPKD